MEHLVLERGRVAETWRGRWESFCLVTPNWTVRLPGGAYVGEDAALVAAAIADGRPQVPG